MKATARAGRALTAGRVRVGTRGPGRAGTARLSP